MTMIVKKDFNMINLQSKNIEIRRRKMGKRIRKINVNKIQDLMRALNLNHLL